MFYMGGGGCVKSSLTWFAREIHWFHFGKNFPMKFGVEAIKLNRPTRWTETIQ